MKKILLIATSVVFAGVLMTSCLKTRDYICECTYVPDANGAHAGEPNKVETTTIKARLMEQASVDCGDLNSKYMFNDYTGNCLIR